MSESENQTDGEQTSSEHTLPRRQWLTAFAVGGVATATATLGYESCEASPQELGSPEEGLRYIKAALQPLREMDYVAEGKRQGLLSEDIHAALATDVNEYLSTTYQALVYSELVNALPEDLRNSEEIQSDIAAMSPVLDQAVADAYFVLGMADDDIKAQMDRELRDNPDILMDMASDLDGEAGRHGMGIRGRLRLRRASRQLSSQLRLQSTDEVVTDLTDKITRVAERNGARAPSNTNFEVSLAARRMLAENQEPVYGVKRWHPEAYVDPAESAPEEVEPTSAEELANAELERRQELARLEDKEKSLTRASRGLAGAGGGLLIVGGIALGVSGAIGAAAVLCIGGFLLLIALFVVAARARRRRQLEEERARLKSTDGQ